MKARHPIAADIVADASLTARFLISCSAYTQFPWMLKPTRCLVKTLSTITRIATRFLIACSCNRSQITSMFGDISSSPEYQSYYETQWLFSDTPRHSSFSRPSPSGLGKSRKGEYRLCGYQQRVQSAIVVDLSRYETKSHDLCTSASQWGAKVSQPLVDARTLISGAGFEVNSLPLRSPEQDQRRSSPFPLTSPFFGLLGQ